MSVITAAEQREAAVRSTIENIRETLAIVGMSRNGRACVPGLLEALAGRRELWAAASRLAA